MDRIGRYQIIGELGRGAMGVVYHAVDPSIGRSVAIKTIRILDLDDEQQRQKLRERLFREARSAGVLSHPNIVTIYDMDEADGVAYVSMAFVNGPTLEKILAVDEPLSGAHMLHILRQTASGLDYAHGKGIVHRDIKPANIMTDEDGAVKITDFGIAKITRPGGHTDTRTVVGTPNYMSPEQVQGQPVDGKSDQFSLAVIAYEILAGERPFAGEHLSTVVYKIVAEEPAPAHRINGTLTEHIDAVLRKALSKKPQERYPNCSSFVGALEMACAESRGWTTIAAGAGAAMPTVAVDKASSLPMPAARELVDQPVITSQSDRQPRSLAIPIFLSLLIVVGLAALIGYQTGWIAPGGKVATTQATPPPAQTPAVVPKPVESTPSTGTEPPPVTTEPQPESKAATPEQETARYETHPAQTAADGNSQPETPPIQSPVRVPEGRRQDIWVSTNPPGAKAVIDDHLEKACQTPCMLQGTPGRHRLTVSQAGFINEYREINVGNTAQDVPPIALRKPTGTIMLSSVPSGAQIHINGQVVDQTTPAQLSLAPGSYMITVEKNGKSHAERVDLREGATRLIRIPLND